MGVRWGSVSNLGAHPDPESFGWANGRHPGCPTNICPVRALGSRLCLDASGSLSEGASALDYHKIPNLSSASGLNVLRVGDSTAFGALRRKNSRCTSRRFLQCVALGKGEFATPDASWPVRVSWGWGGERRGSLRRRRFSLPSILALQRTASRHQAPGLPRRPGAPLREPPGSFLQARTALAPVCDVGDNGPG